MSPRVARKLPDLAEDYARVTGKPFEHFFCPILYADHDVELCEAHIVNEAFGASSRWTVQRKDVDGFYGSIFESDFVDMKHRGRGISAAMTDRAVAKRLKPQVVVNGRSVDYYTATGPVPPEHTRLTLVGPQGQIPIVLKLRPEEVAALKTAPWRLEIAKDLRIAALVSTLKAAHLTLFQMLGYRYALSPGGRFLGDSVLGRFFLKNAGRPKAAVLAAAHAHFREFAHMMRPLPDMPESFKGTAEEQAVWVWESGGIRWGMVVMVRTTPGPLHAVLVPIMTSPVAAETFMRFLQGSSDERITARLTYFRGDHWEGAMETVTHHWPKTGMLYPEEPGAALGLR
jgi:hypothetical protein